MEQTELLIYIVFLVALVLLVIRYWKTGRND